MKQKINSMLSFLIYALGIFFITFISSFYFIGMITEYKFKQAINNFANITQQNITVVNYQRHWFNADATIKFTINPNASYRLRWQDKEFEINLSDFAQDAPLLTLTVKSYITHGPLVVTKHKIKLAQAIVDAKINLTTEQNALLQQPLTGEQNIAFMRVIINHLGNDSAYINSGKFNYQNGIMKILWSGISWQLNFSKTFDTLKNNCTLQALEINTKNFSLRLDHATIAGNLYQTADKIWLGDKSISLPFLRWHTVNGNNVVIHKLNYKSSLSDKNKENDQSKIAGKIDLAIDNLKINDLVYKKIALIWQAGNLNANTVADLIKQIHKIRHGEKTLTIKIAHLVELLLKLLDDDATVDINKLEATTLWGDFNATAHALFKPRTNNTNWMLSLLANTQVAINIKANQNLVSHLLQLFYQKNPAEPNQNWKIKAQRTLSEWVHSGKLIAADNYYNFSLDHLGESILLNNQPISLVDP